MARGKSYTDPIYDQIEAGLEKKYNLPTGGMRAIRTLGERSNADQVSSKGAATVYQIIPSTRKLFKDKYGVDAYASKEAAAEVAALHLRDSMQRNKGNWRAAVAEYNGGTDKRNHNNSETRAYVERVTGRKITVPAGTAGGTMLAPEININDLSYDELKNMRPADITNRNGLGPRKPTRDVKVGDLVTENLIGGRSLAAERGSTTTDLSSETAEERTNVAAEAERAAISFSDRMAAAVDKNWILNQVIRGMDRDTLPVDQNWSKEYVANIDKLEAFAETPAERKRLRETAGVSKAEYNRVVAEITAERAKDKVINSNGTGLMFELGSSLLDPVGWVATAGVGKALQIGSKGYTLGKAAIEGSITNMGFTAALDFSGVNQDASDYALSGVTGLALGAALYPAIKPSGKADTSLSEAVGDVEKGVRLEAVQTVSTAMERAGPEATPAQIQAEVVKVRQEGVRDIVTTSLADVGDNNKFLTVDEDAVLLKTRNQRQAQITKSGLDAIDDEGEKAIVAEITARSEAIAAANPIDEAGLQGRLLRAVGQESTGLTLLRSQSPVLKATAINLLEGTTGAGGRGRTAAMQQVTRERVYMRHMVEYEQMFNLWRKEQGIGWIEGHIKQDARRKFDREIFLEVEARYGQSKGFRASNNNAVARAADAWENGMEMMAKEQKYVGTLGSARLPESSVGYMRHVIDPRRVMKMDDAERRAVEDILAKQFNTLNEFSYVNKETGETIKSNFDKKFSRKLAKAYLNKAARRGNGSYDVPVNIHSPEAADIVEDAIRGMRGLPEEDKAAILGKFSRGGAGYTKGRLKLDLRAPIGNGKVLADLFQQDVVGLYRSYARRASGEVALAQYGVYGKKSLDLMREAAFQTGATADELKAFDQIASEFLNQPYKNAVRHAFMDNVRIATSAARLGGMGFTQLGEFSNGLAALGVSRVMKAVATMPKMAKEVQALAKGKPVNNPVLNSIDTLGGHLGIDGYQMTRMFDLPDSEVQLYNDNTVGTLGRFLRGGSHMTAVASGHRLINAVQIRGMSEQIVRKAVGYIRNNKEDKALLDMGFTPDVQEAIRANMDKIAKFDKRGNLLELDLMAGDLDPNLMMKFRDSVERGASQIIQRAYIGETGAWAHNDFLKVLFQFRTFSLTSIEKQWGRNQRNYGAVKSFAILMGAMSFAAPIHFARLSGQMIGKSEKDRQEMLEERMSAVAIGRATLNYASSAGLLGDLLDVSMTMGNHMGLVDDDLATQFTGGGQGRQSASGLVPGIGMIDDLLKGTVGGQPEKLAKLTPGANLPFVVPLINGVTSDED